MDFYTTKNYILLYYVSFITLKYSILIQYKYKIQIYLLQNIIKHILKSNDSISINYY